MRVLGILAFAAAHAAFASQVPSNAEIRRILVERIQGFENSVGIVVGVIEPEGRRIVAYGSMGGGRPVDGDTLFEIGSITKVFTSLALADMVERGEVRLDDPVEKYLPPDVKVPSRNGRKITLVDLATHRSGLPRMPSNFVVVDTLNPYPNYPVERMYEFLNGHTLTRDIDAEWEYSNIGVGLLGHALARRAGTDYEGLMRQRVLTPLGLKSTAVTLTPELRGRFADGHSSSFRTAPTPHWDLTDAFAGAGVLRSSVNDLLTFLEAPLGYRKTPLDLAFASMLEVRRDMGPNVKAALGWAVENLQGVEIVRHGGATYGFRTMAGYDPKNRVGVVVLSNYNTGVGIEDILRHLLNPKVPYDDGSIVKPRERAVSSIPADLLGTYAGRYRFDNGEEWTVRREGTRFFLTRPAEPEFEIFPEGDFVQGDDDFFAKHLDALFTFAPGQLTFHWAFADPRVAKKVE